MINIREGCFETNSSSTHNMVIVEDSQLEKWRFILCRKFK